MLAADDHRYRRQSLFPPIGLAGQRRLGAATVAVVGCGATGGATAQLLARAGIGRLVMVDRDLVAEDNLHRQVLFNESDAREMRPKAEAAAAHLREVNSQIKIEPAVAHLHAGNIDELLAGTDLVVDGTDNVATRFLLNDWAFANTIPWIYVGAVGGEGMLMPVVPPHGPCLRCLLPEPPPPGVLATCDTAGVVGPVPAAMGAMAATEAIKLVIGAGEREPRLRSIDFWHWRVHTIALPVRQGCPTCVEGRFEFLEAQPGSRLTEICGRDSYQIVPRDCGSLDLAWIASRWKGGNQTRSKSFIRIEEGGMRLVLFADGRALIEGAGEAGRAQAFYDRVVGA